MKKATRKFLCCLLAALMFVSLLPLTQAAAASAPYTLDDGYITATVSGDNGGFAIRTAEGDKLIKSDNDKELIYPFSDFDTSFTSFEVTNLTTGKVNDYLFGGAYSLLGGNNVTTTQDATGITSTWPVDGLTFTQRIELAPQTSTENGMAYVSYGVTNANTAPVSVKARLLLDTALGSQDYGIYEVADQYGAYREITKETVLNSNTGDYIPQSFFVYDDNKAPSITAYTVNSTAPYQIAFAHWNSLASTLFDFTPDPTLDFTNQYNTKYLTADSAVAYYYDMGTAAANGGAGTTASIYYGVYSNQQVTASDSVAVNLTAPAALTLSADKTTYLPADPTANSKPGVFSAQTEINNFVSGTAKDFSEVTVAAYAANGITPLDDNGNALPAEPTYLSPYTVQYPDFKAGATRTRNFYFQADVGPESEYRKVDIRVFDTSTTKDLTQDNLVGSRSFYILCPGGDGQLPKITFTGASPNILYYQGTRHLSLTGSNLGLLENTGAYTLNVISMTVPGLTYTIPYNQIAFNQDANKIITGDITLTDTMVPGSYRLEFDWTGAPPDGADSHMTAPALNFVVSNDIQYKTDCYGIVAVVRKAGTSGPQSQYDMKVYKTEADWAADMKNYEEALLVFRGSFDVDTKDRSTNVPTQLTATSIQIGGGNCDSVVTVNNCMDFQNGTVTVTYTGNSITVDFDGDLYTSGAHSKIWSGKSTFTEIKNGTLYGLVRYDSDGKRLTGPAVSNYTPITLLWPCGLSLAQSITGMVFNLAFGTMGIVYNISFQNQQNNFSESLANTKEDQTKIEGYCVSFSAKLDLGFLVPNATQAPNDDTWNKLQGAFSNLNASIADLRNKWNGLDMTNSNNANNNTNTTDTSNENGGDKKGENTKGQASVMVQDIMYGCGKGFMGVNFNVNLVLPSYAPSLPVIKGKLAIDTIGNWSVAVDGSCKFATLELEASIALKAHNGIPVPDKLYFYMGGFEPGINVDGFGVLWITGVGGGFDNLYDTIFGFAGLPPLKLMLSISFDIMKTLQARADLTISLRGFNLKASDVGIKAIKELIVFKKIALEFDWDPAFYFMASVNASILDVITGSGYIVVMQDSNYTNSAFVEFFIRAAVQVPALVPMIGGMNIGSADFGVNNTKIWGALNLIGLTFGVTYVWGGSVSFDAGSAANAKPTFPDLLQDYPVGYDPVTGQTLYMRIGANVSVDAIAEIVDDFNAAPQLLGVGDSVGSKADKLTHQVQLGAYAEGDGRALTITYAASDLDNAKVIASQMTFDPSLTLNYYNNDPGADNSAANANLSYDSDSEKATLTIAFNDASEFNTIYTVMTAVAADLVLYDVAAAPAVMSLGASITGSDVDVNWSGTKLGDLDSISFYLTKNPDGAPSGDDYMLGSLTDSTDIRGPSASFPVPDDLQSGVYYIRAVYSQQDVVNNSITGSDELNYTNANQPSDPTGVALTNNGDLMFNVAATNSDNIDGYMVNLYNADGTPTDFAGMTFDKADDGSGNMTLPVMLAGGSYDIPILDADGNPVLDAGGNPTFNTVALTGGQQYVAGVSAYKYMPDSTNPAYAVYSNEVLSAPTTLNTPMPPTVDLTPATTYKTITRLQNDPAKTPFDVDTFKVSDVSFDVTANMHVTGAWTLDGGAQSGSIDSASSTRISLTALEDGEHTITARGANEAGDNFNVTKIFAVDTKAPTLILSSPTNGGFFGEDGSLTLSGVTDPGAVLKVVVDGTELTAPSGGWPAPDPHSGTFSTVLHVDPGVASHYAQISATSALGNSTEKDVNVVNIGMSDIVGLSVYMNGAAPTGGNLPAGAGGASAKLSLAATTSLGNTFLLDNSLVAWSANAAIGSATVDQNGVLSVGAGSMGAVTGRFYTAPTLAAGSGLDAAMTASATFGNENNTIDNNNPAPTPTPRPLPPAPAQTPVISDGINAKAGQFISVNLPQGVDENTCAPYCYIGGVKTYVGLSAAIDGKLYFIAPYDAVYYIEENDAGFSDTSGHWAKQNIDFSAARGLLNGVGAGNFDPDSGVTRGMFVTILGRLANIDVKAYATSGFGDVKAGAWYAPYVTWAADNGVVLGLGDGNFGPDKLLTREQMCTILQRFLAFMGYSLAVSGDQASFIDQSGISDWAAAAVAYCKSAGLIQGRGNGKFDPQGGLTRAEASAVLDRLVKGILQELIVSQG